MKKSFFLALLPMAALLLAVAGCDEGYSDQVVYELRTDPIKKAKVGFEPTVPDRPGQLPLLKISDLDNEHNPFYLINKEKNLVENEFFRDPMQVKPEDRNKINAALEELFGTPANPRVGPMSEGDRKVLKLTEGSSGTLVKGSKLYRLHCLHCHGVAGDGRGPTARWVNPHPRDYRDGRFKFQSVELNAGTPHRDDLLRVLEIGVEGTAMPSFVLLPIEQREALVSYVIHLALRGKTELDTFNGSFTYDKAKNKLVYSDEANPTIKASVMSYYAPNVEEWVKSQSPEKQIKIGPYPFDPNDQVKFKESVLRGKAIFENPPAKYMLGKDACMTCHKDYGRRSNFREDEYGTFAKPNNLLLGVYRGGRRPIDIYRRIHSGIAPSGMIAFISNFTAAEKANPAEVKASDAIWDLVNFVQVLGNPAMRRQMGIFVD